MGTAPLPDVCILALREWQGFYQVMGESSATLTGLMFVSVTVGARLMTPATLPLARTFITPILGLFLSALVLSALLCIPTQTRPWLAGELATFGLIGLFHAVSMLRLMYQHRARLRLEARHWLWHLIFPGVVSLCVLVAAAGLWEEWLPAFNILAFAVMLLVTTGVVNAWEIALMALQVSPEEIESIAEG